MGTDELQLHEETVTANGRVSSHHTAANGMGMGIGGVDDDVDLSVTDMDLADLAEFELADHTNQFSKGLILTIHAYDCTHSIP